MYAEFRLFFALALFAMPLTVKAQCPESLNNANGFGTLSLFFSSGQAPSDLQTIDINFNGAGNEVNTNHEVNLVIDDIYQTTTNVFSGVALTGDITLNYTGGGTEFCAYEEGVFIDPLPVELSAFSGQLKSDDIILYWTTEYEEDNAGFEIEQSFDGESFSTIGMLDGAGSSEIAQSYNFTDHGVRNRALGSSVYYRLVQIDFDGTKNYSEVLALDLQLAFEKFEITKITGWDSAERTIQIYFYVPFDIRKINFLLADINGRIIEERSVYPQAGLNTIELDLSSQESPFYFLSLNNGKEVIGKKVVLASDY